MVAKEARFTFCAKCAFFARPRGEGGYLVVVAMTTIITDKWIWMHAKINFFFFFFFLALMEELES